jgi:RimJ/RimL family protein N-acetyltransferase
MLAEPLAANVTRLGRLLDHYGQAALDRALGDAYVRGAISANFAMGVVARYARQGVGTQLLEEVQAWARRRGLHRLEMTVISQNLPALSLYLKMGFVVEGRRNDALRIDGRFVDEYWMAKLLA